MKFIVDAQLPKALCLFLVEKGHDCIHTLEMPRQNKSSDQEISEFSLKEKRILISKDVDFYNRYLIKLEPHKLIYLATGNISNKKSMEIIENNLQRILEEISFNQVIEITKTSIITIL